jgi:hypothetical protein
MLSAYARANALTRLNRGSPDGRTGRCALAGMGAVLEFKQGLLEAKRAWMEAGAKAEVAVSPRTWTSAFQCRLA